MMKRHPILFGFLVVSIVAVVFYFLILGSFSLFDGISPDGMTWIGDSVGVVEIKGLIDSSDSIVRTIREYEEDDSILALLVRIDSPGGMVAPTQEIYSALRKAAQIKPVFASMGSTAASGGYYIACAADRIVANPGTLTGSIGVIMEFYSLKDAFDKVGVENRTIKSGKHKDAGNIGQEMSRESEAMLQEMIDDVYRQFVEVVSEARKIDPEETRKIADGRVFSGAQAKELNLVDHLGTFYDAVDLLKEQLGVAGKVHLIFPKPEKQSLMDYLLDGMSSRLQDSLTERKIEAPYGRLYFR